MYVYSTLNKGLYHAELSVDLPLLVYPAEGLSFSGLEASDDIGLMTTAGQSEKYTSGCMGCRGLCVRVRGKGKHVWNLDTGQMKSGGAET